MKAVKDEEPQKIVPNSQLTQELTDEQVEEYQEEMIKKGLEELIQDKPNSVVDNSIAYFKLFAALLVNTTSAAWVTGTIELLTEFEQVIKHSESIEVITKRFIYLIEKYKKANQETLETLKDNINFVNEQLEK